MLKKKEKQHIVANEKAITLIALVVTIVILLILAGVTITMTLGQNGLFMRAQSAKEVYEESEVKDDFNMLLTQYTWDRTSGDTDKELGEYLKDNGASSVNDAGSTLEVKYKGYLFIVDKSNTSVVNVNKIEVEIVLDKNQISVEMLKGSTTDAILTATLKNANGELTWSSSDISVAEVVGNGNVGNIKLKKIGKAIITVSYKGVKATCDIVVSEKIKIGTYVDYNIEYNDIYTQNIKFTRKNGWRYLGKDKEGNYLIISTGIPVIYHYLYSSKEDWWGSNSDVASEFGTEYATGYNNFPNRYASYGLRHNLENISYVKEENKTASQIKSPTRWKNMIIGNSIDGNGENNTLGTVFRANNMNNNILNVRMLTLEELNEKINEIDESNNRERLSVTSLPKDTKYGIFNFTDISNYAFSYEVSYGLASPCTITNQVSTTNKCIHYVQLQSKTSITIWQTQTNATSSDCMGLRPVIVLSSKIQLIDTDGDGVLEIK